MAVPEAIANPPATQAVAVDDTPAIRSIRADHDRIAAELKASRAEAEMLKGQITAAERAKMDELDRLKAEKSDLETKAQEADRLRAENGRFMSQFETQTKAKIDSLPENVRETARAASEKVESWADRFDIVSAFERTVQAVKPQGAGTNTQPAHTQSEPGASAEPPPATRLSADQLKAGGSVSWKPVPGQKAG